MPQPASSGASGARAAGVAGAAGAAAGTAKAGGAAAAGGTLAVLGAGAIVAALVAFLVALREHRRRWLLGHLGRYTSSPDDIAEVVAEEMQLEEIFAQRSADRLAAGLPQALAIADPRERSKAVRALLDAEERYAQQRNEAMAARAIQAATRARLRRESPLGAYWRKGYAKDPTPSCIFMAGGSQPGAARFWPWAVLDRVHPPRHYGCPDSLHGLGEGIANGWGTTGDVPDTRAAIRAAAGVMMEGEADALLRELDVRDALQERGIDTSSIAMVGLGEGFERRDADGSKGAV